MEENDKNLEQFFQKRLTEGIEPAPWNTPPPDVWTGIETDILRRRGRQRAFGLLLPLMLGAAGLGASGYFYWMARAADTRVRELELRLRSCGESVPRTTSLETGEGGNLVATSSDRKETTAPTSLDKKEGAASAGFDKKRDKMSRSNPSFGQNEAPTVVDPAPPGATIFSPPGPDQKVVGGAHDNGPSLTTHPNSTSSTSSTSSTNSTSSTSSTKPTTPRLPQPLRFSVERPARLFLFSEKKPVKKSPEKKPGLFEVGPAAGAMLWQDRYSGELGLPLSELLEKEETRRSTALGFWARKSISPRWVLETGLFYSKRAHSSTYLLRVPYTLSTEHSAPDGSLDNTFSHTLPSGMGEVNTLLTLNRSATSPVADNEEVPLNFAFEKETRSLFVPLRLAYHPEGSGSGLFVAGGINQEFELGDRLRVTAAKSLHPEVHEKAIAITEGPRRQGRFAAQATLHVGYQLPLPGGLSVAVELGHGRALTDKFGTGGFRHRLDHWGLGAAVLKRF